MFIKLPFKRYLQIRIFKLPERGDDGRFVKSTVQSETTAALRQYANKVDASYDEVKKIAGFEA